MPYQAHNVKIRQYDNNYAFVACWTDDVGAGIQVIQINDKKRPELIHSIDIPALRLFLS